MQILLRRKPSPEKATTVISTGGFTWRFPKNTDLFLIEEEDLSIVLKFGLFEIVRSLDFSDAYYVKRLGKSLKVGGG